MFRNFSNNLNKINKLTINMAGSYLLLFSMWVVLERRITGMLFSVTKINIQKLTLIIDSSFLVVTSAIIFLLARQHLLVYLLSNDQYRVFLHANTNPMWIFNKKHLNILEVNKSACENYGYTAKQFSEMTILNVTSPEFHSHIIDFIGKIPEQDLPERIYEHINKVGEITKVKITAHALIFKNQKCIMMMAEDVTMQVRQKLALNLLHVAEKEHKERLELNIRQLQATLEEKRRLAEVIDRIHNMVIITDPNGVITWVNEAFLSTTGYVHDEVVGKTTHFLHGPKTDLTIQKKIMDTIRKRDYSVFEIINYTKDGKGYWVEVTISAIHGANNDIVRYISIQNIITERKFRDLQIVEQNSVLKKLAWANSHLVRKPIASILSLVELGNEMESSKEFKEIHHLIGRCSTELDNITKEVSVKIDSSNLEGFTDYNKDQHAFHDKKF